MLLFLARHWFLAALLLGVTLALALPHAPHAALQHLPPPVVIALALFLMAWTMPSRSLAGEMRRPWAALWAVTLSYSFVPGAAWLLGQVLTTDADVRVGLLLAGSVPCTLASCVLWTRLAGGNEATALLAVLTSTLASWCFTTFWLALTTGAHVSLPIEQMMRDLALTLVVPVALGQAVRGFGPFSAFADRHKGPLGMLAQLFVLVIILKASASVGVEWQAGALHLTVTVLLTSAGLALGLHLGAMAVGWWSSGWLDRPRRIAVAIASSQKTLPVTLFLYERYFRARYPLAILPLLVYHVGQLLLDTAIAARLKTPPAPADAVEAL